MVASLAIGVTAGDSAGLWFLTIPLCLSYVGKGTFIVSSSFPKLASLSGRSSVGVSGAKLSMVEVELTLSLISRGTGWMEGLDTVGCAFGANPSPLTPSADDDRRGSPSIGRDVGKATEGCREFGGDICLLGVVPPDDEGLRRGSPGMGCVAGDVQNASLDAGREGRVGEKWWEWDGDM